MAAPQPQKKAESEASVHKTQLGYKDTGAQVPVLLRKTPPVVEVRAPGVPDLKKMSLGELKELAKEFGLKKKGVGWPTCPAPRYGLYEPIWMRCAPLLLLQALYDLLVDPELDQRAAEAERKATSEQQRILRKRQLKAAKRMSRQQARGPRCGLSQQGRESRRH